MTKYILVMLLGLVISGLSYSQGEIIQQKDLNYYNENSFGLKLNSNGFGLDYRFEYRYTNKTRGFLEAGLDILKDPKEIKLYNPFFTNQNKFVYGKINSVFKILVGTGIQREIFSKQDKNSLSIRYQIAIGGSFAFAKPIYYNIVDSTEIIGNNQYFYWSPQTFNLDYHNPTDIVSRESWFKGLSETQIIPGVYVRAGMNFEFSNDRFKTKALEIGAEFDIYSKKVSIMAENGQQFFLSIYCSYRFGYKYSTLISRDARKFLRTQEKN
jgi:hypothetical protein